MSVQQYWRFLTDKLDGLQHRPKHVTQSMEEYLQLADEYFAKQIQDPGKKRVSLWHLLSLYINIVF